MEKFAKLKTVLTKKRCNVAKFDVGARFMIDFYCIGLIH